MLMRPSKTVLASVSACAFFIAPALGQTPNAEDTLRAVVQCRTLENNEDRLACFDRASAALETSLDTGAVIAVSREDVDTAERDTFGLSLPNFGALARSLTSAGENAALSGLNEDSPEHTPAPSPSAESQAPVQVAAAPQTRAETLEQSDAVAASRSGVQVQERGEDGRAVKVVMEIERFQEFNYQQARIYMTNGQVWEQTRAQRLRMPSNGEAYAHIRRTSTGIHLLRINDTGNAVQVRRVR